MSHHSRILLADDHTLVAESCRKLLEPEFEVVGIVSDGRALVNAIPQLLPDVVVADIAMPLLNGLDAGEQVKREHPKVKVIYLTMNQDAELAAEAFRRGGSGYLLKTCAASELVTAIREVLRGGSYISPQISGKTDLTPKRARKAKPRQQLTPRQREVLQLLAEGRSMKEAASALNLTPRTVAFHKYRIMEVLGLDNNSELVQYAIREKIIAP
jgi:DNA-binding NarL/FixJ family response regulator